MKSEAAILQDNGLKNTRIRLAVLQLLMETERGFSHQEISKHLVFEFDRVTLFRTLHTFESLGIIHKILDLSGTARYAYSQPATITDQKTHAHFICLLCDEIFCLDELYNKKDIKIPDDFSITTLDIRIKGKCAGCKNLN